MVHLAQWLILAWVFDLQLILTGTLGKDKAVLTLLGTILVGLTAAFVGYTVRLVASEAYEQLIIQNGTIRYTSDAVTKADAAQPTDMIIEKYDGDGRRMKIQEFNSLYEPMHQLASSPSLAARGFQSYQATAKIWAHELTKDDLANHFPKGKFVSADGSPVTVSAGQYLVMPFPSGGDVSIFQKKQFSKEYEAINIEAASDDRVVSQSEMLRQWNATLQSEDRVYAKASRVHAKRMTEDGEIDTIVDHKIESVQPYFSGDYIIVGSRGGRYPMNKTQFSARYDTARPEPASDSTLASAGFKLFKATGKARLSPLKRGRVRAMC